MQSEQQRDEKTVVIATGLGLFCLVGAVGALGLSAATSLLDLDETATTWLSYVIITAAGAALVAYLVRARHP